MSLEAAIKELTTAVQVLTEVMTSGGQPIVNGKANPSSKVPTAKAAPAAEEGEDTPTPAFLKNQPKPAAAKPAATKTAAGKTPETALKKAPASTADVPEGYAPVQAAIVAAVADGHRKSIKDMLAEYDAKSGQDLDPDVYEEVLEKIAVITGGEVDNLA